MSKVSVFTHELVTKVPYAGTDGTLVEGQFVELTAPTSREMEHIASLKQMFYRALPKGDSGDDDDSEDKESPEDALAKLKSKDIMSLIYASEVDINKFLLTACELFKAVGLVDGEQKITKPVLDVISLEDREGMAGDYMLNFILASASQNPKKS